MANRNRYYEQGENRAARVRDLFAAIAPRYDLINDLQSFGLHRWWKRRLVRLAEVRPGQRALDLCCGTGDVAFGLAARGARVVGLDFSEPMLAVARRRQRRAGRMGAEREAEAEAEAEEDTDPAGPNPLFIRGDALQLPFDDAQFDAVTISYGLRNLAGWEQGLEEMWRVARPQGRLLVLDFGKPALPVWRAVYFGYLRAGVPLFGRICCGDADSHAYILASLEDYPAQHGVAARMREMGCRQVRILSLLGGIMTINYGVKP